MAAASINPNSMVVEECPPPPFYFESITSSTPPPVIPSDEFLQNSIPFRHLHQSVQYFDQSTFKQSTRKLLKDILDKAMDLISQYHHQHAVMHSAAQLHELISKFNESLRSFREHEAREILCESMRKQVEDAKALEETLSRLIAKTQEKL